MTRITRNGKNLFIGTHHLMCTYVSYPETSSGQVWFIFKATFYLAKAPSKQEKITYVFLC